MFKSTSLKNAYWENTTNMEAISLTTNSDIWVQLVIKWNNHRWSSYDTLHMQPTFLETSFVSNQKNEFLSSKRPE